MNLDFASLLYRHAALIALLPFFSAISAQANEDIQTPPGGSTYAQDARGVVIRSGSGLCWRTGAWTTGDALPGCDGPLTPPVVKVTAPAVIPAPLASASEPACAFSLSLSGDEVFRFGSNRLTDAAKSHIEAELRQHIAACKTAPSLAIVGHTDRIGSTSSNQRLSRQRAEAVADFIGSKGLAKTVQARGAGASLPVKTCSDSLDRQANIQCLAPNRRVAIESLQPSK
jgi:OmpA-OmpF porin, OOP family